MTASTIRSASVHLLILACALAAAPVIAQGGVGDLTVTPTRLVFEDRVRTQAISLIHRGSEPATYRIEMIEQRMTEDGRFEPLDEPTADERLASPLIRYSPRRVTLEPGLAQTVLLALRKPADLATGEYRSHLALYAEPPADAVDSIESRDGGDEVGVRLVPIYRITVPVIVRHGELDATAELAIVGPPLTHGDGPPRLPLRVERTGERSLFGDLDITHRPADGGEPRIVAQVKGLAVYVPNATRTLDLPLHSPDGQALGPGRLHAVFHEPSRDRAQEPTKGRGRGAPNRDAIDEGARAEATFELGP